MNRKSKAVVLSLLIFVVSLGPQPVRADLFGGDVVVLTQILANALQQLMQLRQILSTGQDSLNLVRDINRGINDSIRLMQTIHPSRDAGIYGDWQRAQDALQSLQRIYGVVRPSNDERIQRDADQSVAEAVTLNNSIYSYSRQIDEVGQAIERASHSVSPGGAQKLTAQSMGVMLHVMNASLRAQATGVKLQAQALAIQNRREKEQTAQIVESSNHLTSALRAQDTSFAIPRF